MIAAARSLALFSVPWMLWAAARLDGADMAALRQVIGANGGIAVLIDLPPGGADGVIDFARTNALTLYVQSDDPQQVEVLRHAADAAGLLGSRIFVAEGSPATIEVAENLADAILVSASAAGKTPDRELLRALRPRAVALIGGRRIVKPVPDGIDAWSHPYHGPDNNPQSNDQRVRGDFRTQFLGRPVFSPMPEQSVIAGGRIYKAMGHIAHRANQNAMLNTLMGINAYNGTILWKRPLPTGFMIHRNTMIATDDALYMGDGQSCKIFDGVSGKLRGEIDVPEGISDGPVWKWMAIDRGTLYALVGHREVQVDTERSARRGLGHWPWGMWKGHDYKDPHTAFGFGRTFLAVDLKTRKITWHYRDDDFIDARGVCMSGNRIFFYSPQRFLACLDATKGAIVWKNTTRELLDAIGPNGKAQHYVTGYATSCYVKCNDDYIFFAGPQRSRLVAASTADGKLAWTHPAGNLQLVLRPDAIYAAGPKSTGMRLDYATGQSLGSLPTRRACTRATGCVDSVFYRTRGGTIRVVTGTNTTEHIAPMRPPCQDGVLIANGHLYWGPWMCGCELSLYGNICLGPVPKQSLDETGLYANALRASDAIERVARLDIQPGDWTSYRGDNARTDRSPVPLPDRVALKWQSDVSTHELPTAPVTAGGLVFVADRAGVVRAFDLDGHRVWQSFTGGAIYYPPAIADGRLVVGSADGYVTTLEARTGRRLWSFRVAPRERRIPVFGKLISTWPVAGGVVVRDGTVYAAAGIADYDGTYVVALDLVTGKLKAHNSTSGSLAPEVHDGISLQGNLTIIGKELRFLGGGVYETARYDLQTLACLNQPKIVLTSKFRTAFYPYYPTYGKYVSLEATLPDGRRLSHDASYEGNKFTNLALEAALPPGTPRPVKEAAHWSRRHGSATPKRLWQDDRNLRFTSFVVAPPLLLATGHADKHPNRPSLMAIRIEDGKQLWSHPLPVDAVKGGTAVDHLGRIFVSLETGQLFCFAKPAS